MTSTVVSDRFSDGARGETRLEIVTPEGVPLVFTVARAGDRAAAFLYDAVIIALALLCLLLILVLLAGGDPWIWAAVTLAMFLLRTGYFAWFELRWQGRTPGKRRLGLRITDARGRPLTAEAVIVRNLTREVELFLPLVALSDPELVVGVGPGWVRALAVLWCLVFLVIPLLNRERRRVGDLLGGTVVVVDPRAGLRRDVSEESASAAVQIAFTRDQLAMYGVYELQVLEDLLRDEPARSDALGVVAEKIRNKIGWSGPAPTDPREFLAAFYRAQRARLEHDLLLGKARERKADRT